MARKVQANLVALGSAAIVAIYAAGYALTEHAVSADGQAPAAISAMVQAPDPATVIAQSLAGESAPAAEPGGRSAAAQPYRDGTYTGLGNARRGHITVAVAVEGGKVTGVKITGATTYFPTSQIARLPGEVVRSQSASIDFVSGATQSSLAFRKAVAAALAKARGADPSASSGAATVERGS